MTGFALVHVEPHHFTGFRQKVGDLRAVAGVTDAKPITRLYTGPRGGYGEFHIIVWADAADVTGLRQIFGALEAKGCHIDGYGQ